MAKVVKAVLVGCGSMSSAWLSATGEMKDVQTVALVDLRRRAAEARAKEFGLSDAVVGTDMNQVLTRTKPDMVYDCTVPQAHCAVTVAALKHGCHVLGEKPLADGMANARKMVAAADRAGKLFAVIQNRRYQRNIRSLAAFLKSGKIGAITTVNADFYIGAHFGGFRDRMKHVLLLDMAIHSFDQARLISGAEPRAVYCREWNPKGSWYDHDASAIAVFEMTGDIVFTYRGSWCAEGLNTSWECAWRIIGEKGTVTWNGGDEFRCETVAAGKGFMRPARQLAVPISASRKVKDGGHAGIISEFVRCIRRGGVPETIAADNIKSLAMVFGAIDSARTRRRVTIRSLSG